MTRVTIAAVGSFRQAERFLIAALALALLSTAWIAAQRIPFPYQLDYGEGTVLYGAERLARGQALYPPVGDLPVALNPYGPSGFYLFALPGTWFGTQFAAPRLLVLLCGVGVACWLVLMIHQQTRDWKLSLLFGLLFLAVPLLRTGWLYFARMDLPGLLLQTAGLWMVFRWPRKWLLAVPVLVLAVTFKLSLLAAPLACIAWFALRREWPAAAGITVSIAGLLGAAYWWAQQATAGTFVQHLLYAHAGSLRPRLLGALFLPAFAAYAPLLVLGAYRLVEAWKERSVNLLDLYFLASSLLLVTAAKPGSAHNHFLGWFSALCLIAALGYSGVRRQATAAPALALIPAALAFFLVFNVDIRPLPRESRDCAEANSYLQRHPGSRILSENVGALLVSGRPVWLSDPSGYTLMVHWKDWSDRELVEKASHRFFDLIVMSETAPRMSARPHSVWPRRFLAEVERNYQPSQTFVCNNTAVFYEPRR